MLQNLAKLIVALVLLPTLAWGQVNPVNPTNPLGSRLFPNAFASADNIAAQTATAIHGLTFIWDGAAWDRWTGAVSQSGTWNITNISGTISLPTGAATAALQDGIIKDGAGDTTQANVSSGRLHVDGSGVTQPVSGTVTANAGSGTFFDGIIRDGTGDTTQANVSNGRVHVDGSGVTQPVSGTVTANIGTFPDNEPINVAQINGVTPLMGAGNTGTGSPRVTIATDQAALPGMGIYVEDAGETAGGNLAMAGSVRRDTAASSAGTTGDNATINTDASGLLWTRTIDPCTSAAKTFLPFSITTATTTEITPSLAGASTNYYVCSLVLVTAAANNVALVDDDTDGCVSVTSGMAGGTTAASGFNMAANSGMTFGNGAGAVFKTNGTNRVICLVTSAATQLSGTMSVVAAP